MGIPGITVPGPQLTEDVCENTEVEDRRTSGVFFFAGGNTLAAVAAMLIVPLYV